MKKPFIQDTKGIWLGKKPTNPVDYPQEGNTDRNVFENDSFWFDHRNKVILSVIRRFPFVNNFADVGGGNGVQSVYLKKYFPVKKFFMIEPNYEGCLGAKQKGVSCVYNMNAEDFPFGKNNIGGIGLFDVLEHTKDDAMVLRKITKQCTKGTRFYLTVPAYKWLWSDVDDYGRHHNRYNQSMIKNLASRSNLDLLFCSYFFFYLPPMIFLVRSLPYRFGRRRTRKQILKTENNQHNSGIFHPLITLFHYWETDRIRNESLPFGASVFAVLQK